MIFISGCQTTDSVNAKNGPSLKKSDATAKSEKMRNNASNDPKSKKSELKMKRVQIQLDDQQAQLQEALRIITEKTSDMSRLDNASQLKAAKKELTVAKKNARLISKKVAKLRKKLAKIKKKYEIRILNVETSTQIIGKQKQNLETHVAKMPALPEATSQPSPPTLPSPEPNLPANSTMNTDHSVKKTDIKSLTETMDMLASTMKANDENAPNLPERIPDAKSLSLPQTDAYSLPMDMTKDIENPMAKLEVKFNFDAESLVNVVQMFSLTLDFQYYIDPGVSGSVTMTIDTQMTRREAWELFEHILWISGSYASKHHGFINILPFNKMPQERRVFAKHDPIPNVHVEIVKLFNTTAADISNLIKPFITAGATVSPIQYLNSLLIIEAPPNMVKLRELINKLDVMGETDWPQISIKCNYVESEVILEELKQILPILGFSVTTSEKGDGHSVKIIELARLQVLIAAAPTMEVLDEVKRWVKILDSEESSEEERIFFYDVKYNNAEDLSDNVSIFFNSSSSSSSRSRSTSTTPTSTTTGTDRSTTSSRQRTSSTNRRTRSSDEKPATVFDIPVTILADGAHNRLVIRTTPRAYLMLEALLKRLDTPPLQVLIQVTIAEIQLDEDTQFGFKLAAGTKAFGELFDYNLNPSLIGANTVPATDLYNFALKSNADGSIAGPGDFFGIIRAVAGETNTKVLSSPQLIAISDEEASINVGNSVPIITEQLNNNSNNTGSINQNIQYQDTGTILTVTPHITAKKLVTLDIRQEESNALPVSTNAAIQSPIITSRVIETSMIIKDGATVMLGGFIRNDNTNIERKIPILGDIPYLGKFFSFSDIKDARTELLLIITVNVIDIESDIGGMMERYRNALNTIRQEIHSRSISLDTKIIEEGEKK